MYMHDLFNLFDLMHDVDVKNQYFELLNQLTDAPVMSHKEFINKVTEISKIGIIMCCVDKSKIIGTGTIIYEPKLIHGGKLVGHIEDIVVDKNYRNKGIARKIINALIRNKACYKFILDCKDDLVDFYTSVGFKRHGNQMAIYN